MKVLMINGSPRKNGNTARALKEVADALAKEGVESEVVWIGVKPVRGCIACGQCHQKNLGRCAFDDDVANRIVEKLADADGIVLGSPTYYGQPNGALLAVWQRVCFAAGASIQGNITSDWKQFGAEACEGIYNGVKGKKGLAAEIDRSLPDDEHAVRDAELSARHFAVLEHSLWKRDGRMRTGRRRNADDAHDGPQHGVAYQEPQGQSTARARALADDELLPLNYW